MKNGPPLAFRLVCARRGDLPALDLLELRRHDRRGAFKVGTDRRAPRTGNRGDNRHRARKGQKLERASARLLARRPEAREKSVAPGGLANPYPCPRDAGQVANAQSDSEAPLPAGLPCHTSSRPFFRRHPASLRKSRAGAITNTCRPFTQPTTAGARRVAARRTLTATGSAVLVVVQTF
jgi:hypothetical protein